MLLGFQIPLMTSVGRKSDYACLAGAVTKISQTWFHPLTVDPSPGYDVQGSYIQGQVLTTALTCGERRYLSRIFNG
jgi:hypothetical protein